MPSHQWIKLVAVEECPPGRAKFVAADNHDLAVFHLADPDRFVVTSNSCPHAEGSLAAGELEGNTITCPWHAWTFDLDTGKCPQAENVTLRRYQCRVENGDLFVNLPA